MKIAKKILEKIINEEILAVLLENTADGVITSALTPAQISYDFKISAAHFARSRNCVSKSAKKICACRHIEWAPPTVCSFQIRKCHRHNYEERPVLIMDLLHTFIVCVLLYASFLHSKLHRKNYCVKTFRTNHCKHFEQTICTNQKFFVFF